jgi:hypothetical protein
VSGVGTGCVQEPMCRVWELAVCEKRCVGYGNWLCARSDVSGVGTGCVHITGSLASNLSSEYDTYAPSTIADSFKQISALYTIPCIQYIGRFM